MNLFIDTSSRDVMVIALYQGDSLIGRRRLSAPRRQAEKLLSSIDALLKVKNVKLSDLSKIMVNNQGDSFTSLRIGVITANALSYALQIPVEVAAPDAPLKKRPALKKILNYKKFGHYRLVEPVYTREPNIGQVKKSFL